MANTTKESQRRQKELAYMRMVKQTMQPKSTEERQKEIAAEQQKIDEKRSAADKRSNFLYYNKKWFLIGAVIVIAIILIIVDLTSVPQHDVKVIMVYHTDTLDVDTYLDVMNHYIDDYDHNGQISVGAYKVCLTENQDPNGRDATRASMGAYFQLEKVNLYLVDEDMYDELMGISPEVFVDMEARYPGDPNADGKRYLIEGTKFAEELGLKEYPENFAFIMRLEDHAGKEVELYGETLKMLDRIVAGEPLR